MTSRLRLARRAFLAALSGSAISLAVASAPALAQEPMPVQATVAQPPVLPETEVQATTQPAPQFFDDGLTGTILDGTIFSSPPADGYLAESSTTGSIINVPDADLPATVNVITRDVMNDQIALRIEDIVRNAGGAVKVGDGQFADRIFLRGLEVGARNYRKDGFLDPTFVPRDFQNVERVEILKGPASVLYGAGDPAGIVNLITKRPLNAQFADVGYTFGSFEQQRFTLDMNGYGTQCGNVLYRINVAQEDANSFVDFDFLSRTQVAPVVTWLINPSTTLTWNGEWHRDNRRNFQGTPAINGDPLFLPPERFIGEPTDFVNADEFRQSLVLTHEINDCWWFNIGANSLFYSFPSRGTSTLNLYPPGFFGQKAPIGRGVADSPVSDEQSQSVIANLAGEFCTGDWKHKAVVGVEYNYFDSNSLFNFSGIGVPIGPPDFVFPLPFDAANPVYGGPNPEVFLFGLETNAFRQQRVGGYVQDLIEINPYWKLMAGVRVDTVDFTFDRVVNTVATGPIPFRTEQEFNRTSPRGGIVYQPFGDEVLSYYYSYSQSFTPPGGGAFFDFEPLLPVLGESHEAGLKTELLPGLSVTACGFFTTRENDTFVLSPGVLTQVGEVRSQGAEVNILGTITDRWSVIANYTYADTLVSDVDPQFDGRRARNVPFNTANVWTRYNLIDDECQTFGAALGLVYLGDRFASLGRPDPLNPLDVDVILPEFARWDAGLYYTRGQFYSALYVENLFDLQYAQSSISDLQIFQGAPINARANVGWVF